MSRDWIADLRHKLQGELDLAQDLHTAVAEVLARHGHSPDPSDHPDDRLSPVLEALGVYAGVEIAQARAGGSADAPAQAASETHTAQQAGLESLAAEPVWEDSVVDSFRDGIDRVSSLAEAAGTDPGELLLHATGPGSGASATHTSGDTDREIDEALPVLTDRAILDQLATDLSAVSFTRLLHQAEASGDDETEATVPRALLVTVPSRKAGFEAMCQLSTEGLDISDPRAVSLVAGALEICFGTLLAGICAATEEILEIEQIEDRDVLAALALQPALHASTRGMPETARTGKLIRDVVTAAQRDLASAGTLYDAPTSRARN